MHKHTKHKRRHIRIEKSPPPAHLSHLAPLPPAKLSPIHVIAPAEVKIHTPEPGEPVRTKAEQAARKSARARRTPDRISIHAMISAARYQTGLSGTLADAEAHPPISFSRLLHGDIGLLDD